jgi:hypothetical protein
LISASNVYPAGNVAGAVTCTIIMGTSCDDRSCTAVYGVSDVAFVDVMIYIYIYIYSWEDGFLREREGYIFALVVSE